MMIRQLLILLILTAIGFDSKAQTDTLTFIYKSRKDSIQLRQPDRTSKNVGLIYQGKAFRELSYGDNFKLIHADRNLILMDRKTNDTLGVVYRNNKKNNILTTREGAKYTFLRVDERFIKVIEEDKILYGGYYSQQENFYTITMMRNAEFLQHSIVEMALLY